MRSSPLTTPTVIDPPKPNGLPIAIANWPGRASPESPNANGVMFLTASLSTFTRARSLAGLVPRTSPSAVEPSWKEILIRSAFLDDVKVGGYMALTIDEETGPEAQAAIRVIHLAVDVDVHHRRAGLFINGLH